MLAAVQMTASHIVAENLAVADDLIARAAELGAKLVVLPEMFAYIGDDAGKLATAETLGNGPIQAFLQQQARTHRIWIVGGTIAIKVPHQNRAYAACLVWNDQGSMVAQYNKIHLFDVSISNTENYQESKVILPGTECIVVDSPFGKLGLAVCYDIRFPELFRRLFALGAEIFIVPAAFTVKTGQAHWEVLARSRAIENFCYFVGACETGTHYLGRKTYGHSLIVNPWGEIIASLAQQIGIITADIDLSFLHQLRRNIPIDTHRRLPS